MAKITSSNRKVTLEMHPASMDAPASIVVGASGAGEPQTISEQELIDICADSIEAFLAARARGPVAAPRAGEESPEPKLAEDLNPEDEKKNPETPDEAA